MFAYPARAQEHTYNADHSRRIGGTETGNEMPKHPPWEIRVTKGGAVVQRFEIPHHIISKPELKNLLRAIVVSCFSDTPREMAHFYFNHRAKYARYNQADVRSQYDLERGCLMLSCGEAARCYAEALHPLPPDVVVALKIELEKNRKAAHRQGG